MKYHDNEVVITVASGSGYRLISGSYTIDSYSVTSGQDPDNNIYTGLSNAFGSDGKMSFRAGRKGSSSVAKWFKGEVNASQTTFNHDPGDLNFSFLGKMELKITGGVLGSNDDTFVFSDIVIAQGHAGSSNNWWFGGKNCKYIGNNTVACRGISASGMAIEFKFVSGGNRVNEVMTIPTGVSNWMSNLDDSVKLGQLTMPGSHDAGMSQLSHCNPFIGSGPYTQTQSGSIGTQLTAGSRYFDIRIDYDHSELVTYHRTGAHGCNGQSLKSVFDEAQTFLENNSQEVAIFRISHIRNYGDDHNSLITKEKINTFINGYTNVIYVNSTSDVNLMNIPLGDTRGKLILAFNYSEYIEPSTGRFRYMEGSSALKNSNLTMYDSYSNTSHYDEMEQNQLEKWNEYGQGEKDYCFLLSWTLTSNKPPFSPAIATLAKKANSQIASVMNEQIVGKKWSRPNIVYMDFVTSSITASIISYNFDGSLPLKSHS